MKDIIKVTRDMDETAHIMMIKAELLQRKQMLNILEVTGDQVIHADHFIAFADKFIAKMRTQKARSTRN